MAKKKTPVEAESTDEPQQNFGWVPPEERTADTVAACTEIESKLPTFHIRGSWLMEDRRYALWRAPLKVLGRHLKYFWQIQGSCVGASGGNIAKTVMAVEIANGEPEEFRDLWWLYTYGRSRLHSGMRGRGHGSTGTGYARAITEDGIFEADFEGLPKFRETQGWLKVTSGIETEWSDGGRVDDKYKEAGRKNLFKTAARLRSSDDAMAALVNGYGIFLASMFGTRGIRQQGTPAVNLAEWNDQWPHQMYCDEVWDHPTLGTIFRIGNNWGPGAHPAPTGDEPNGGFYVKASTFDRICRSGEVFALSQFDGFPAGWLNWDNLLW